MTKLFIGYIASVKCVVLDGVQLRINEVGIYTEDGKLIRIDHSNIVGCWLKLFGDFELVTRKKVAFTKNELYVVKEKGINEYNLYIPFSALQGEYIGEEEKAMDDAYVYTYDVYHFNGGHLTKFSDDFAITKVNDERIKVMVYKKYEHTDKHKRLLKLSKDIEDTCSIHIDLYKLKEILKHYKITKIRRKKVG